MNWIVLKALNKLYTHGEVAKNVTISASEQIHYLKNSLRVIDDTARTFIATPGYKKIYEELYLNDYELYHSFLISTGLLKRQSRFEEADISILMNIKAGMDDGSLVDLRNQIIACDESIRGVSLMFFRNDKYLEGKSSLVDALKIILDVEHLPNEKDQQYMYRLECAHPSKIVLCENLHFLTLPNKPRAHGIELWYAGGKNVQKLEFADPRGLPIFYSCDWDYDGICIIYPLVKARIPGIQLLIPTGEPRSIVETGHNSKWTEKSVVVDELPLSEEAKAIIRELIASNCWIIEESNKLMGMLGEG